MHAHTIVDQDKQNMRENSEEGQLAYYHAEHENFKDALINYARTANGAA